MSADPNKKSARTFQCRDVLWETFEQMARELECSIDYLINESMKQYARQRSYSPRTPFPGQARVDGVGQGQPPMPMPTGQGPAPDARRAPWDGPASPRLRPRRPAAHAADPRQRRAAPDVRQPRRDAGAS